MRISDWSSDVCSSDLTAQIVGFCFRQERRRQDRGRSVGRQTVAGDPPLADARLLDKHDPRFLVGARTLSDIPADESLSDGRGKRNSPCAGPVRIARDQPHRRLLILLFEADTARARGLTTRRPMIFPWPVSVAGRVHGGAWKSVVWGRRVA